MERNARPEALHQLRAELKAQGRLAELVLVQQAILAESQAGPPVEVANAHNYLSVIFLRLGRLRDAEAEARAALSVYAGVAAPSAEVVGCYQCVLARVLAAQGRFTEAVEAAEAGYRHYAAFHNPPDDFLTARAEELAALRRGAGLAPLEW
jgi:hypothetical protein